MDSYSNLDGIYQLTRSAKQMNYYQWNNTVIDSCNNLLTFFIPKLNNKTYVLSKMSTNTHVLPGIVGAVSECIMQFPHLVNTTYSWRCCAPFM